MTIEFDELQPSDDRAARRPSRRVAAALGAAMLVAAAGGVGFGIGRSLDDGADDRSSVTGAPSDEPVEPVPTSDPAPPTTPADAPGSTVPASGDAVATVVEAPMGGGGPSGGAGYAAFGSGPMDMLFERTTGTGFGLRVALGERYPQQTQADWGAGEWRPAPWCFPSAQLRVSLAGNGVVDVGGVPWYEQPYDGRAVSWLVLGGSDNSPQWVVVVQAPPDTTNVRATFADGSSDEVAPQNGIAALTAPGEPPTRVTDGEYSYWRDATPSFDVTFEGGSEPVTVASDGGTPWDDPVFRDSCTPPPPELPEPGEQPADPVAAEAAIRESMALLYGAIGDEADRGDLIDDPTGVADARAQVLEGSFAEAASSAEATIEELVFTDPGTAWFRYAIDTSQTYLDNRYGIAVEIDGVWKITRATICQDLSLAGGDCGGGWETVYPPGVLREMPALEMAPATTEAVAD